MKYKTFLKQDAAGALWLQEGAGAARPVVTVADACRRLRRSRRQVYRLMNAGRLGPLEKMLGEWLLDKAAVDGLARAPLAAQPLPGRLKPLFPEYEPGRLNAGKDSVLVIARVLESGSREDLRWLMNRYPAPQIRRTVETEASRLLSTRSRRLWSLVFKVVPRPLPAWRRTDPWSGARS